MIQDEFVENIKKTRLKKYIMDYVLPLVGFTRKEIVNQVILNLDIVKKTSDTDNICKITIDGNKTTVICHIGRVKGVFECKKSFSDEEKALTNQLLISYSVACSAQNTSTDSLKYITSLYRYAVDRGISSWIINNDNKCIDLMDKLFDCLDDWSLKTYEGHKVCFGIIVNNNNRNVLPSNIKGVGNIISFLNEEYAAVLSDGITSIFEIDKECNLIKYSSITENNVIEATSLSNFTPYRFSQVITKFVERNKVGIFLLINGDIIIARDGKICFIKRNGRWLNFSYDIFKKAVTTSCKINDEFLEDIYGTMLDISLSHGGGIISVVDTSNVDWNNDKKSILNDSDILFEDNLDKMFEEEKEKAISKNKIDLKDVYGLERCNREAEKKVTKRYYLETIIGNNTNFRKLDRKLRCELSCLDGASIFDIHGAIISFGAIIQNDAGSQGGGRGAAARKLSNYGGFAIKISTDGYIEVYVNGLNIYSIK